MCSGAQTRVTDGVARGVSEICEASAGRKKPWVTEHGKATGQSISGFYSTLDPWVHSDALSTISRKHIKTLGWVKATINVSLSTCINASVDFFPTSNIQIIDQNFMFTNDEPSPTEGCFACDNKHELIQNGSIE